jgi:hypothetical protein
MTNIDSLKISTLLEKFIEAFNDHVLEKKLTSELGHKLLSEHEVSPLPPKS